MRNNGTKKAYFASSERRAILRERKRMAFFKRFGLAVKEFFKPAKAEDKDAMAKAEAKRNKRRERNKTSALCGGLIVAEPRKVSARERKANHAKFNAIRLRKGLKAI